MLTLNFKSCKFYNGAFVIIIKKYSCGDIHIAKGEIRKVTGSEVHNYPDLGLFGIRIVHFEFF